MTTAPAKFISGNIFRHIFTMSATNAIGLTALFLVDLADLFFISLLGQTALAAAVGFAGTIVFFTTSIAIGQAIAMTALVSRAIGQQDHKRASQLVIHVLVAGFLVSCLIALLAWLAAPTLVSLIGASDETAALAVQYLRIVLPAMPLLSLAMSGGAALRSVGDAKRAMLSTLAGGGINAVLDPLFIFALGLGLPGAAYASVVARLTVAVVALSGVFFKHRLVAPFRWRAWLDDLRAIFAVALPAMITNVATPFGNAYVTAAIAAFGDAYVAGWAVVGRLIPVAFGMIFSLSGAVGPIIGQNFGAHRYSRIEAALKNAMAFTLGYVLLIYLVILLLQNQVVAAFGATGEAAEFIRFFCVWISASFVFNGALFIANASFNNLGYPMLSTLLNVGKATLGTLPFVFFGSQWYGAEGALVGQALGSVLFGALGYWAAFGVVRKVRARHQQATRVRQADKQAQQEQDKQKEAVV